MKKQRTLIVFIILAIIAAAGIYAYREYYRKPAQLQDVSVDAVLSADSLLKAYASNEATANQQFLGKVVDITGEVASITTEKDTVANILLGPKDAMAHVSCTISASSLDKVKSLAVGSEATIRGVCTGFLMDVELNRCVIIK